MAIYNTEFVYLGHDNSIDVILKANSTIVSTSTITTIKMQVGKTVINSTNASSHFIKWNKAGYDAGEVRITLGTSTDLKPGKYDCMLVVYGSTYSNGLVWGESIPIRIVKNPETT